MHRESRIKMKKSRLILIRGLPGSGKSTLAAMLNCDRHFEADDYFVGIDGVYRYDASKIREAHEQCQLRTSIALQQGYSVVVANTFTRLSEMHPYFIMARIKPLVIETKGRWPNIHGVPNDVIAKMQARWEEIK